VTDPDPTPDIGTIVTNPTARTIIYGTYGIIGLIAAATTVGFAAAGNLPEWLTIANAVIAFLGGPVGGLAVANVKGKA
jgi:hypothetical protein